MHRSPAGLSARLQPRAQRGFTMLEILVVLAILGLLAGVLIRNVTGNLDRGSQDAARLFVSTTLQAPLVEYRIHTGDYPTTAEGLQALVTRPQNRGERWRGPYVKSIPLDPWGEPYLYRYPGVKNTDSYDIYSKGPDRTDGTADDIGNW